MQKPEAPPEAVMIDRKRRAMRPVPSVRAVAPLAGISEGRWRQIVKGYQSVTRDVVAPVSAPADTIARMLMALGGVTDAEYDELCIVRPDVAEVIRAELLPSRAVPDTSEMRLLDALRERKESSSLESLTDEDLVVELLHRLRRNDASQEQGSQAGGTPQQSEAAIAAADVDEAFRPVDGWLANDPAAAGSQHDAASDAMSDGDDTSTDDNHGDARKKRRA